MRFTVKGGNKNIEKTLATGEYSDQVKSMPSKPINGKLKVSVVKESEKKDEKDEAKIEQIIKNNRYKQMEYVKRNLYE